MAGLMARVAYAGGASDEARVWLARGAIAPHDPDWSDLDPEGAPSLTSQRIGLCWS